MKRVDRLMIRQLFFLMAIGLSVPSLKAQSVLAIGNWYKVGVTQSGIYKLDRTFLSNIGVPVSSVDPRTIKVYGNGGGGILPQLNSAPRPFDVQENAILEVGDSNSSFDSNEYFLFYGQSPDHLTWNDQGFSYEKNIYSDTTYYFITYGGSLGQRIQTVASEVEQEEKITSYDDVFIHEIDERNRLNSGRRWLGESLSPASGLSLEVTFTGSNILSLDRAQLEVVGESENAASVQMTVNDQVVGDLTIYPIKNGLYTPKGIPASGAYALSGAVNTIKTKLTFDDEDGLSICYVDWFSVKVTRALAYEGGVLSFRSLQSVNNAISSFSIANTPSNFAVWDVTEATLPVRITHSTAGGTALFTTQTEEVKEFVAFSGASFPAPTPFGRVPNQSIKSNTSVDAVIIVHPAFLEQAQRLANFHASHSNLSVAVVTTRQVYNEFSSGRQDVSALRDYARYVYEIGGTLKYLLLFGDASYDYKNRSEPYNNFVPVYESYETFHPIYSYSSDDYYGFFDADEGEWEESVAGDHTMEIGVGRLPVKTLAEAKIVVDKIIRYASNPSTFGPWRNKVVYVADDGDGNLHQEHAESLSDIVLNTTGQNVQKIYLDAFDQIVSPSSEKSPTLNRELVKSIENGALLFNYIGHGSEFQWMDEQVLTSSEIFGLRNYQKLSIFVTATCQFGRYDNAGNSGAEDLILGEQGAIALLTTTRLVFANTNFFLNQAFHLGWVNAAIDPSRRLGDILRDTKNNGLQGPVNRNFALLGDPMLRPSFPEFDITIDQLNTEEAVTWSALERITLTGKIRQEGEIVTNFSGKINATLFDIPVKKITKGQESSTMIFEEQDNVLYRGEATVTNGAFTLDFIVPKNISYQNLEGRLSLYAWDNALKKDAGAMLDNLLLGGTDHTAPDDTTPPALKVYLNEPGFRNGGTVGPGAVLIARFEDESGINISNSGFDRGITMDLNGQIIELNQYYTADTDTYQRGAVVYPLNDLAPGSYTAIIKGSDVYNNPVSKSVDFVVSNQPILQTFNLKTYPNPAQTLVNFSFDHDREGESLIVDLVIYSMNGDEAFVEKSLVEYSPRSVLLTVDMTAKLPRDGMYVYRLAVKSTADGALRELSGRLVIGN